MRKTFVWTSAASLLFSLALAGPEKHPGRLVVADGKVGLLQVIDLEKGQVIAAFSTPGPANVYASGNGMYAFSVHREQNRVSVVYGGLNLEDHGDHKDLVTESPYILHTLTTGPKPTHFKTHAGVVTIYNDGDGTVTVLEEKDLGLRLRMSEIATGAPDHGAPVFLGGYVLAGSLNRGVVEIYSRLGRRVSTLEGCPRLHGEAVLGNRVAFGCADGVLIVEQRGLQFVGRKLPNPTGAP